MLEIENLSVDYVDLESGQKLRAVDAANLRLEGGQILALLGPSGCGKSTLLRAVAGLEAPATGCVRWDGADLRKVPVHRRGFVLLFQDGQLFPTRNVAQNIAYGLESLPRGLRPGKAEREARVAELLELVQLPGYQERGVRQLSGGQAQRVALARALAPRPKLLLLDEPLSALDTALRYQLAGDLRRILKAEGIGALYVTHDPKEAKILADRTVNMDAGRLLPNSGSGIGE